MAKIKVYSTQTCPYCIKTRDFLKQKKIKFEYIDVNENHEAAMEMIKKSGQTGVPVLDIGGEIITGFDKEGIIKALKKKKLLQ